MKTYLVTGAAGFIGGALAKRLIDHGNNVITIDNLSTGSRGNIPDGVTIFMGNCQEEKIISGLDNFKFDAIFHFAGQSSGEISFDDPVYDLQTNTQSTLLLLKLALKTNCKKYVYASSMSVYGDHPDKPIDESAATNPKSFYGVGKLASEYYLKIYQQYGITSSSLRIFNAYGPGQNMENLRQGMVSIFLSQAIKNRHIHVKGSADRYRDFIYIDDIVDAALNVFEREESTYKVYNIAGGRRTSVSSLIDDIKENLPFDITVEYSGSTPGDQFGIYADINKIKNDLGWEPKTKLSEGIKKMAEWALQSLNRQ